MRPEERQREEDFSAKKFSMESPIFELEKERERERESGAATGLEFRESQRARVMSDLGNFCWILECPLGDGVCVYPSEETRAFGIYLLSRPIMKLLPPDT